MTGGDDAGSRSQDVDACSPVGEGRQVVADVSGSNGDGTSGTGRAVVAGIAVVVSSSNHNWNSSGISAVDS